MAKSLRDQLIKSGAANADKSGKRGKKQKRPKAAKKDRAPGSMTAGSEAPSAADVRSREQAARDRELNRQQQEKLEARAVAAQIRQLIERNLIDTKLKAANREDDEAQDNQTLDYNFTDDRVVRRMNLPADLHRRVVTGSVAIAKLDDQYRLIPRPVAEKISQRDDSSIIVLNDTDHERTGDESMDDEYAQFEVPDDLMW